MEHSVTFVTDEISKKYLHSPESCTGEVCCFHNPSDHHMNIWPLTVRHDRWCMTERLCPHGCGHPDPDSIEWMKRAGVFEKAGGSVHGCDGCCSELQAKERKQMKDPWNDTTTAEDQETAELSDRDRVTVTMKGGTGFDAPWIVLHAKDVDEANRLLDDTETYGLVSKTIAASKRFTEFFGPSRGSASPSNSPARASGYGSTQNYQQPPVGAPTASCPVHQVGLVYNAPFSSGGKQISARMACPERGCRAITFWHNKDGSWKQG